MSSSGLPMSLPVMPWLLATARNSGHVYALQLGLGERRRLHVGSVVFLDFCLILFATTFGEVKQRHLAVEELDLDALLDGALDQRGQLFVLLGLTLGIDVQGQQLDALLASSR